MTLEPAWVNGQPGFRTIGPDGRLVNVVGLDILDGRSWRSASMLNPDKLAHLGETSDLGSASFSAQISHRFVAIRA